MGYLGSEILKSSISKLYCVHSIHLATVISDLLWISHLEDWSWMVEELGLRVGLGEFVRSGE